jgi:ppGpp synthetase/RelA/SpoT-type nucleotidyltranferase
LKIDKRTRDAYGDQLALNQRVKEQVELRQPLFDKNWHFVSRLKQDESFALKVEAGICDENLVIDDFFACTIVVRNSTEIAAATKIVEDNFDVVRRRPFSPDKTKSRPTEFQFDDLRMYVRLKPGYAGESEIHGVVFEVQVKTFLQHAWAIATHDLTYKTDEVNWARFRVASQIRAMLEHAELSIERFESLASSNIIAKEYQEYVDLHYIISALRERFDPAALPKDLQRLSLAINVALAGLGITSVECMECLDKDTAAGRGVKELNLSPYSIVLQSVLAHRQFDTGKLIAKAIKKQKHRPIMLSKAVTVPDALAPLFEKVIRLY